MASAKTSLLIQVIYLLLFRQYTQENAGNRSISSMKDALHLGEEVKLNGVDYNGEDLSNKKHKGEDIKYVHYLRQNYS